MSDFAPQMHVRKVGNGYIATVTVDARLVEAQSYFGPREELRSKTEEIVFETLESLAVFMFHHFEREFIQEVMSKAKKKKKELTQVELYDEVMDHQEDSAKYMFKRNYSKVFPDYRKKNES